MTGERIAQLEAELQAAREENGQLQGLLIRAMDRHSPNWLGVNEDTFANVQQYRGTEAIVQLAAECRAALSARTQPQHNYDPNGNLQRAAAMVRQREHTEAEA